MLIRSVFRLHLPRSMNHNVVRTLTDWCQAKLQGLQQHLAFLICHDGLLDLLLQLPVTFDAVLAWCYNKMTHVFFFSSGISDLAQGWSRMLGPHLTAATMMCACGLQLFVCVGILIAFAIGLPYDGKEAFLNLAQHQIAWWRVMFAIGLAPATLQVRCRERFLQN